MPPNATIEDIEAKRREMGLDQPLPTQYAIWLRGALHGDFGRSIQLRRDAAQLVATSLPATIQLALCAMLIAGVLGLAGGLLLFHLRGRATETLGDLGTTILLSVPEFLWALLFILLFGVLLPVLPFIGQLGPRFTVAPVTGFLLIDTLLAGQGSAFASALAHLVLPARRARHRLLARHHARAALRPAGCLSGGLHPPGTAARHRRMAAADRARTAATPSCRRSR